ncbi:alpha/beta hydrolase [Paenibacillus sp. chi10]|uniref:Alpha/beta hydrolase n=1 Tax=Paenibacillus suaedae TaxID=3077233 RepID=A0AAJ2K0Q5_9BACL|nr:alpha/beta hydrolase [Paenibacillus sp. chi10]MDT8978039.1 alpha/beta hydrolase [Paenibacillus sp. chi10]
MTMVDAQRIPVADGHIHIASYGMNHEEPVMLLHGTAAYHYCWRIVAEQLASQYRIYCPDLLGSGFSDKPRTAAYSKRAQAKRIQTVIEALDCGSVHLVGHSMCGEIAVHLALQAPHLVRSLTLVAPDGFRRGVASPVKWAARKGWMEGIFRGAMKRQLKPGTLARMIRLPLEHMTPAFMDSWTKPYQDPNIPYVIAKTLADDDTGAIAPRASEIAIPTMLIYGSTDKMIPMRVFRQYEQTIPGICTEIYDGFGHVLMEECPDRLAASIRSFIDKIK